MDINIDKLTQFENIDISELPKFMTEVSEIVTKSIYNEDVNTVNKDLSEIKKIKESFFTKNNLYNDISKQRIYYFAVINTLMELTEQIKKANEEKKYFIELNNKYVYLKDIITYLYEKKSVSATELSNLLNLNINILIDFMESVSNLNFFSIFENGEKRLYFINSKGILFYNTIKVITNKKRKDL